MKSLFKCQKADIKNIKINNPIKKPNKTKNNSMYNKEL